MDMGSDKKTIKAIKVIKKMFDEVTCVLNNQKFILIGSESNSITSETQQS